MRVDDAPSARRGMGRPRQGSVTLQACDSQTPTQRDMLVNAGHEWEQAKTTLIAHLIADQAAA